MVDLLLVLTIDFVIQIQEDFDEFSDVEDLYSTLPMEKVEALEDMVSLAPSSLIKVGCELLMLCFTLVIVILLIETTGKLPYVFSPQILLVCYARGDHFSTMFLCCAALHLLVIWVIIHFSTLLLVWLAGCCCCFHYCSFEYEESESNFTYSGTCYSFLVIY